VVADLQHVDRTDEAARDERRFDRCLGVAGEQGREAPMPNDEHDRPVVDVALRERRGGVGIAGVEDLDRRCGIQRDRRAGAR
jgi:hypothetical protein